MLNIGINGFGRIGKAIFRSNQNKKAFNIVAINDINPDIGNLCYQLNYDTLYSTQKEKFKHSKKYLFNSHQKIRVFHKKNIDKVNWGSQNIDIIIDASGILENCIRSKIALKKHNVKKIIITNSPDEVDFTMVLGANEDKYDTSQHHIISSGICDSTALGPILKIIQDNFGIKSGYITTLHPWLNYQTLMDGPSSSWSVPGKIYHHYALGRSTIGNMIPKPTSAIEVTCKVVDNISEKNIGSFSYRTPTAIVGSADITLNLSRKASKEKIICLLNEIEKNQTFDIIHNNFEPLVSLDFKCSEFSAIVDHRWTDIIDNNLLKLVLWYDNEWGYAASVIDQITYISTQLDKK